MIKQLVVCVLLLFAVSANASMEQNHRGSKDYSEYTEHQRENLTFNQWWRLFKQVAKEQGERVNEIDRKYYEVNYYDEGYFPDEAFEEEYD